MSDLRRNAGELVTQLEIESERTRAAAQEASIVLSNAKREYEIAQTKAEDSVQRHHRVRQSLLKAQDLLAALD